MSKNVEKIEAEKSSIRFIAMKTWVRNECMQKLEANTEKNLKNGVTEWSKYLIKQK